MGRLCQVLGLALKSIMSWLTFSCPVKWFVTVTVPSVWRPRLPDILGVLGPCWGS